MRAQFASIFLPLLPLVSAHFELTWPTARGFDEDKESNFPCGGFDSVSSTRTPFPMNGGPIQLNMGHTQTKIEVLLALGNDPGSAFNLILVPTFQQTGPQDFCIGMVTVPSGLNFTEGTNATIQVQTNGDSGAGSALYQCADVTLTRTALSQSDYSSHCRNDSHVSASEISDKTHPNGTSIGGSGSTTSSSNPASTTPAQNFAVQMTVAPIAIGAMGLLAGLIL